MLSDSVAPLRAALVRVALTFVAGWAVALPLRDHFGYDADWGAFGLTASAGVAAWVEFELLRRWLFRRIGAFTMPVKLGLGALAAAAVAGGAAWSAVHVLAPLRPVVAAAIALPIYGVIYLALMTVTGVPEAAAFTRRFRGRGHGRRA